MIRSDSLVARGGKTRNNRNQGFNGHDARTKKTKKRKQDQKLLALSKRSRKEKEMSAVEKTRSVVKTASSHARQKLTINGRDKANSQRPTRVTIIKVKVLFFRG